MKRALILMTGLLITSAAHADFWPGLWHTPDQRGEQLMRQGDAAAAAKTYSDPRHKAYAELQAGDYDTAAKDFANLDDSDAHYNRGNALVHSGQLQDALKAYDSALARNPDNRDAQHNRDLVEQALKQQQSKQQQSSGQQQKDQQQKDQQKQDQQQQQGNGQPQSGKDGEQKDAQKDQQGQPQNQQNQQQADARNNNGKQDQQNPSAQQPQDQAGQGEQKDKEQDKAREAEQAQRDAANSLAQQPQTQPAGQATQEQWLRRIPDDPGGLLRRKFMIEHMMRQKGQQKQNQQRDEQGTQP